MRMSHGTCTNRCDSFDDVRYNCDDLTRIIYVSLIMNIYWLCLIINIRSMAGCFLF